MKLLDLTCIFSTPKLMVSFWLGSMIVFGILAGLSWLFSAFGFFGYFLICFILSCLGWAINFLLYKITKIYDILLSDIGLDKNELDKKDKKS